MLKLNNVSKIYEMGKKGEKDYQRVDALKGISLDFRDSEFVSILGPSGCGKTTLLNIIGGLDHYSDGDLSINGTSTKTYKDKEWDNYRNHSVGFVFQSYNLIPHLTVIQNVELALTLSGIKSEERRLRAKNVLEQVGLGDKLNSRPNQLSGGQMQRVAIARALVNDPEIILADEPTGALDSKTSVQVMELLKEISKERLIIMVTHNPELAEKYSSRIIKLFDGQVIDDSNPYSDTEQKKDIKQHEKEEKQKQNEQPEVVKEFEDMSEAEKQETLKSKIKKSRKKSMSIFTAFSLSLKNLLTKKARTFLVSFAGSIGIIGIALILSLSSGFSTYINNVQEDTLSTYPITISSATIDYTTMFTSIMSQNNNKDDGGKVDNAVNTDDIIVAMFKSILSESKANDLKSFKSYLDGEGKEEIEKYVTAIQYTYNISLNVYDNNADIQLNPNSMFYSGVMVWLQESAMKQLVTTDAYGALQTAYKNSHPEFTGEATEVTPNLIQNDPTLAPQFAQLLQGTMAKIMQSVTGAVNGGGAMGGMMGGMMSDMDSLKNSDLGIWTEMINNPELINSQFDVVAHSQDKTADNLIESLAYNEVVLVEDRPGYVSDYVLYALGIKTSPTIEEIAKELVDSENYEIQQSHIPYDQILGKTYTVLPDTAYYMFKTGEGSAAEYSKTSSTGATLVDIREELKSNLMTSQKYDELVNNLKSSSSAITLTIKGILSPKENASATSLEGGIAYTKHLTDFMVNKINSEVEALDPTALEGLRVDLNSPETISFYCVDFEAKNQIESFINAYNDSVDEEKQISYTDYVGLMMSSISLIISSISYVLIAFTSVSLIVSSIMIGIITYISVLERTKEIGVLRSIGASKRDIKRVFTAESLIIGFTAGMFGIIVTLILTLPINLILGALAGISGIAALPLVGGIVLVIISMLLTFIAGLIPARIASKKDPVIALRTE